MEEEIKTSEQIWSIPVNSIAPNPNQPRKVFCDEGILKLADSIRQFGIIQPLSVRKVSDGYELIAGERRLRAAKELGMTHVPCVLSEATEAKSAEISMIENLIREDLNIFEQALAIQALIDTYGMTQEQIAEKLSNSQSFIANKLRLLRLSQGERETILKNNLSERHARALLRIFDPTLRQKLLSQIISEGLNVAKTDELIDKLLEKDKAQKPSKKGYKDIESFYTAINRALEMVTNCGIAIKSRRVESDNFTELTILIPKHETNNQEENKELITV